MLGVFSVDTAILPGRGNCRSRKPVHKSADRRVRAEPEGRFARLLHVPGRLTLPELRMRSIFSATVVLVVTLVQVGLAAPVPPKRGKALTPLENKLVGTWKGMGGCDGRFVFREGGTYELTGYGPDNSETAGTWKVHGDSLP